MQGALSVCAMSNEADADNAHDLQRACAGAFSARRTRRRRIQSEEGECAVQVEMTFRKHGID